MIFVDKSNKIFSMDDAKEIRRSFDSGEKIADIARGHLVSHSTIRRIIKNQTYRVDNTHTYIKGVGYCYLGARNDYIPV